jgi:hypothetical protein
MLDAILTDVEVETVGIVWPSATRIVKAAVLVVHHEERSSALEWLSCVIEHAGDAARRTPARSRMIVLMPRVIVARCRAATNHGLARYRA